MTTVVTAGQSKNFFLGPSYYPGAPSPDTLDLRVLTGGEATVSIATNNDPKALANLVANGGKITAYVGSHMTATGTVSAIHGGDVAFAANWLTSFNNDGTSIAASGGSIEVPISVIGKGLFLIEPRGTMTFASAYTPGNGFSSARVEATQSVDVREGTLVIDYLPGFKAPVSLNATGTVVINNLVADSATYDPAAHLVDFIGGGQVVDTLSVTLTTPGGSLKIAKNAGGFVLTDPAPQVMAAHHHHAWG
jgi:hypothetical protein